MAGKRKTSFVVYADNPIYDEASDEDLGRLFRAMLAFVRTGEDTIPAGDPLRLVWVGVRHGLELDAEKWRDKCDKRAEAGKLGGMAKASNAKQKVANVANASFASAEHDATGHGHEPCTSGDVANASNSKQKVANVAEPEPEPVPEPVPEPENKPTPSSLVSGDADADEGGVGDGYVDWQSFRSAIDL